MTRVGAGRVAPALYFSAVRGAEPVEAANSAVAGTPREHSILVYLQYGDSAHVNVVPRPLTERAARELLATDEPLDEAELATREFPPMGLTLEPTAGRPARVEFDRDYPLERADGDDSCRVIELPVDESAFARMRKVQEEYTLAAGAGKIVYCGSGGNLELAGGKVGVNCVDYAESLIAAAIGTTLRAYGSMSRLERELELVVLPRARL